MPNLSLVAMDASHTHTNEIPSELAIVVGDFPDLFPDNLLEGLPTLQDIQYDIDLVSNAVLPNRAHYRKSPKNMKSYDTELKSYYSKDMYGNV